MPPQRICLSPNLTVTVNVTIFGNMIFANVIKDLRCNHCRFRMDPNSNTSVFIKERRGRLETQKHRDREGGTVKTVAEIRVMHVSTSPGKSRITASCQKLGDRHGTDGPSELPEGNSPSSLSLEFYPPQDNAFLLFYTTQFVAINYSCLRK